MDGMKDSRQFHKANVAAYTMSSSVAVATGVVCLALVGQLQQSYLISNVADPTIRAVANALVAAKGVVLYVVWNLLLVSTWTRRMQDYLRDDKPPQVTNTGEDRVQDISMKALPPVVGNSPPANAASRQIHEIQDTEAQNVQGCGWPSFITPTLVKRLQWAFTATVVMAISFLTSQLIPSLANLAGLTMAIIGPLVMFGLPAWFFLKSSAKYKMSISNLDKVLCVLLLYVVTPLLTIVGTGCSIVSLTGAQCPSA